MGEVKVSKPEVGVSETLKKAQSWELQIWSEERGYDYVEIYLDDVVDIIDSIKFLEKENERYREALEFYADEETYEEIKYEAVYQGGVPIEPPSGEPPLIYYDKGKAARKALEGE